MKGKLYLNDAVNLDSIRPLQLNIIDTPTGSGKTTFALGKLTESVSNKNKMLYLIDTVNGKQQIMRNPITTYYNDSWREVVEGTMISFETDKVVVMTYAKFGVLASKYPTFGYDFEVIICDELHSLLKFQHFGKTYDDCHTKARERLEYVACESEGTKVVAITATPQRIIREFGALDRYVSLTCDDDELFSYETKEERKYTNIERVLDEVSGKGIIFVSRITQMKAIEELCFSRNLQPICVWSIHNKEHTMNDKQMAARAYILDNEMIPPQYNVLIINASSETSINLRGNIDYMIIHSTSEETQTQVRGRLREDLEMLYTYSNETELVVPQQFMGIRLDKAKKDELCQVMAIRDEQRKIIKWPTLAEKLVEVGYTVAEKRTADKRYTIITLE